MAKPDQVPGEIGGPVPGYPLARSCPYRAPAEAEEFRDQPGLGRVGLWDGTQPWLITRHGDARTVLSDARFSADVRNPRFPLRSAEKREQQGGTFIRMDDPEHARLRRMLTREFSVRYARSLEASIAGIAEGLLDGIVNRTGPVDLIEHYTLPLSTTLICLVLGVPVEDHLLFQRFTRISLDLAATYEEKQVAVRESMEYYRALVERKRTHPDDGLISRLVAECVGPEGFLYEDLPKLVALLVSAGHETTSNQLGLTILGFLRDRENIETCRQNPERAVEEALRYWSINNGLHRVALEPAHVGGAQIAEGDGVIVSLVAANRDPAVFSGQDADANEFDTARPDVRRHLAFGFGTHQCLGQNIARVELAIALSRLFERLPGLRLAVPVEELSFKQQTVVFGLLTLPVTWDESTPVS